MTDLFSPSTDVRSHFVSFVQAIPFLHFLLEGSTADSDHTASSDRAIAREDGGDASAVVRSWSTFLCLHLVGDDTSPLFEVACRALFYLRPRQLPRFVERLARFRAYANEIRGGVDAGVEGDGVADEGQDDAWAHDKHEVPDASSEAGASGGGASGGNGCRRGDGIGTDRTRSTPRKRFRRATERQNGGFSSTASAADGEQSAAEIVAAVRSPSSPRSPSRRTGEGSSSDSVGGAGLHSSQTTRTRSVISREHSPEPVRSSLVEGEVAEVQSAILAAAAREKPRTTTPTAPTYFARALACLPPPAEDGKDGYQRHARLSLLLGARMFTEACRLLRARSWEGAARTWRHDRGAVEAWAAAMRLLGELERMAAEEDEVKENDVYFASASGYTGISGPPPTTTVASHPSSPPPPPAICGSLSLQYRMAFEDALVETVLADSPERMEMVMRCRPSGLAPVAVVRMVRRRAAEKAAVSSATSDVHCGGDQSVHSSRAEVVGGGAGGGAGEGAGEPKDEGNHVLSGSIETLKRCLLLLWEDGTIQGGAVPV